MLASEAHILQCSELVESARRQVLVLRTGHAALLESALGSRPSEYRTAVQAITRSAEHLTQAEQSYATLTRLLAQAIAAGLALRVSPHAYSA